MGNMSYCRFENTEEALEDCYEHIKETDSLNEVELNARLDLIQLCVDIALGFGHEVNKPIKEV